MNVKHIALSVATSLLLAAGCGQPDVSGSGGNGSKPGGDGTGPGYMLPPPGTGNPGGGTNPGGGSMPTEGMNCGNQKFSLEAGPADLLLVLDRSGSMLDGVGGGGRRGMMTAGPNKWDEVVAALDPVIKDTQGTVSWGLKLFPMGTVACGVGMGVNVPVAPNGYDPMMAAIRANTPVMMGLGTPTRAAVDDAAAFMKNNPSDHSKFLVVATDGLPNCAGGRSGADDQAGAINAIDNAAKAGIPSFVVGIATAGTNAHQTLNQMAVVGLRPRNDPMTKYYPVASRDELVATLNTITMQIASCTFPLKTAPPDPNNVVVKVNNATLPRDPGNGWGYSPDNRSVIFFGPACDTFKNDKPPVDILYGCPGGRMVE